MVIYVMYRIRLLGNRPTVISRIRFSHGKTSSTTSKPLNFDELFGDDGYIIYTNGLETFAINKKCSKPFISGKKGYNKLNLSISVNCECKRYPNIESSEKIIKTFLLYEINVHTGFWAPSSVIIEKNDILNALKMFELLKIESIIKLVKIFERDNEGKILNFLLNNSSFEEKMLFCELQPDLKKEKYYLELLEACPDKLVLN